MAHQEPCNLQTSPGGAEVVVATKAFAVSSPRGDVSNEFAASGAAVPVRLRYVPSQEPIASGRFGLVFSAKVISVQFRNNRGDGWADDESDCTSWANTLMAIKVVKVKKDLKGLKIGATGSSDGQCPELNILGKLRHQNIVRLHFFCCRSTTSRLALAPRPKAAGPVVMMFMEHMPMTLYDYFRRDQVMTDDDEEEHLRILDWSAQLGRALEYLGHLRICHRDVKPANILVGGDGFRVLKLADFGCATEVLPQEDPGTPGLEAPCLQRKLASYMCSRYYRAPELILGSQSYGCEVDVWSAGCVVAEMATGGIPLFAGESSIDQLVEILGVLGPPTSSDLVKMRVKPSTLTELVLSSRAVLQLPEDRLRTRLMECLRSGRPNARRPLLLSQDLFNRILNALQYDPDNRKLVF